MPSVVTELLELSCAFMVDVGGSRNLSHGSPARDYVKYFPMQSVSACTSLDYVPGHFLSVLGPCTSPTYLPEGSPAKEMMAP